MTTKCNILLIAALMTASAALSACGGMDEIFDSGEEFPVLFECGQGDRSYRLHDGGDGQVALEIMGPSRGNIGSSTWLVSWTDMRVGYVTGQQGGHQSHLRLSDNDRHYIFHEGEDGQLADSPGRTYAGVALIEGDGEAELLATCDAEPLNRGLIENVRLLRENAGLPALSDEDRDGQFDGWY